MHLSFIHLYSFLLLVILLSYLLKARFKKFSWPQIKHKRRHHFIFHSLFYWQLKLAASFYFISPWQKCWLKSSFVLRIIYLMYHYFRLLCIHPIALTHFLVLMVFVGGEKQLFTLGWNGKPKCIWQSLVISYFYWVFSLRPKCFLAWKSVYLNAFDTLWSAWLLYLLHTSVSWTSHQTIGKVHTVKWTTVLTLAVLSALHYLLCSQWIRQAWCSWMYVQRCSEILTFWWPVAPLVICQSIFWPNLNAKLDNRHVCAHTLTNKCVSADVSHWLEWKRGYLARLRSERWWSDWILLAGGCYAEALFHQ